MTSSFTLTSYLHSKRIILQDGKKIRMYYMNCGAYHSFLDDILNIKTRVPRLLSKVIPSFSTFTPPRGALLLRKTLLLIRRVAQPTSNEKFCSILWGPTADSLDLILKNVMLPELHIGDWLVWENIGSYSIALATTFNGFPAPVVIPIIRKRQWLVDSHVRCIYTYTHTHTVICFKHFVIRKSVHRGRVLEY